MRLEAASTIEAASGRFMWLEAASTIRVILRVA